jgi:hypothetical protein
MNTDDMQMLLDQPGAEEWCIKVAEVEIAKRTLRDNFFKHYLDEMDREQVEKTFQNLVRRHMKASEETADEYLEWAEQMDQVRTLTTEMRELTHNNDDRDWPGYTPDEE